MVINRSLSYVKQENRPRATKSAIKKVHLGTGSLTGSKCLPKNGITVLKFPCSMIRSTKLSTLQPESIPARYDRGPIHHLDQNLDVHLTSPGESPLAESPHGHPHVPLSDEKILLRCKAVILLCVWLSPSLSEKFTNKVPSVYFRFRRV